MTTTRTKTNGAGGLKWSTIAAFLALLIPILGQLVQFRVLAAEVRVLVSRLADHIDGAKETTKEIKAVAISHDDRLRANSSRLTKLEAKPE